MSSSPKYHYTILVVKHSSAWHFPGGCLFCENIRLWPRGCYVRKNVFTIFQLFWIVRFRITRNSWRHVLSTYKVIYLAHWNLQSHNNMVPVAKYLNNKMNNYSVENTLYQKHCLRWKAVCVLVMAINTRTVRNCERSEKVNPL